MRHVLEQVACKLSPVGLRCDGDGVPVCPSPSGFPEPEFASSASESSSSPSATIRCHDCYPQIADDLTITLGNLGDPWGGTPINWNGSHTVYWNEPHPYGFGGASECAWQVTSLPGYPSVPATANLKLVWSTVSNKWVVTCHANTATYLEWEGPTDPCNPTGSYGSHTDCGENFGGSFCSSQGATTCVVS
jgi:hypothetical protein